MRKCRRNNKNSVAPANDKRKEAQNSPQHIGNSILDLKCAHATSNSPALPHLPPTLCAWLFEGFQKGSGSERDAVENKTLWQRLSPSRSLSLSPPPYASPFQKFLQQSMMLGNELKNPSSRKLYTIFCLFNFDGYAERGGAVGA